MAEQGFKRKLTAILSADVEGYSRLMDDDEEATVHTLTTYRTAINDLVQQYRGRIVDNPGDNILSEFASVVDAVNCAVEIQRELAERNAELPYNRKMEFRIGINLGDVIEEEGRIYGDGVNIAARVEAMAEAGGTCISGSAYDQVANKLGLKYENLGEHQVKNIATPIRIFRVLSLPGAAAHRVVRAKTTTAKRWKRVIFAIMVFIVVSFAVGTIWRFYFRPSVEPASVAKMAYPLPDKPSIAVLPFTNMSDDPKQEYFADGMTEDLITDLSQMSNLFVIARNSTFFYKGKPVKIRQVAEELGVRYVLEGSVRKAKGQVRINAQLIDATTGHHLWAERYDGMLEDIFAL
jgi:adenylate cyclase